MIAPSLAALIDDRGAAPLFWPPSRMGVASSWYGHVPFGHWVVAAVRPRLVVELGTHNGVSLAAFCEAVRRLSLPARCVAVDSWRGDAHAGFYGDDVYRDLAAFVARHYPTIAELRRLEFAAALDGIADGSIDLLHVDGRHRYEDVREDYESWRPKLSPRGVVLFHDICETREDFGVARYWAELSGAAPHFTFGHAHGLGVLAAGREPPEAIEQLCALRFTHAARIVQARFAFAGDRWVAQALLGEAERTAAGLQAHGQALQAHIEALQVYISELEDCGAGRRPA